MSGRVTPLRAIHRGRGAQYIEAMHSLARSWSLAGAAGWLNALPSQCLICRRWQRGALCEACLSHTRRRVPRCPRCAIDLRPHPAPAHCVPCDDQTPEFDRAITALDYAQPWSTLLARLKFSEGTALARPLGKLLAEAVSARSTPVDFVLPVPLSTQRLRERGYNQSWLLAQAVSRQLKLPARHDLLKRAQHTERLMTLDAEQRRAHIHGVFEVPSQALPLIEGRHLAVVDDVMTTGATLNEVSATLLEAGARSVSVWVLARTPAPKQRKASAGERSTEPDDRL